MKNHPVLPFKNHMLLLPILFVLALWFVFWFEVRWDISFNRWGVLPREFIGLRGVLFSPFIHGDASHLWHNTLPLFILSTALLYFYESHSSKVLFVGFIITGLTTWCIGRSSYHIGASGIIYMLFGFLLLKGLLTMHLRLLAVSFFVVFVYGGMIWYIVPIDYRISWEGHLSGLLVGFLLALYPSKKGLVDDVRSRFAWEIEGYNEDNDPFMRCFDENGRFVPTPVLTDDDDETKVEINSHSGIRLIYHTIPSKKVKKRTTSYVFKKST